MSDRNCTNCIADKYCDEIPYDDCWSKKIIVQIINKERTDVINECIELVNDIRDLCREDVRQDLLNTLKKLKVIWML